MPIAGYVTEELTHKQTHKQTNTQTDRGDYNELRSLARSVHTTRLCYKYAAKCHNTRINLLHAVFGVGAYILLLTYDVFLCLHSDVCLLPV